MGSWDFDAVAGFLKCMCADLEVLKSGNLEDAASFAIRERFVSAATDLLAATSDPAQSVKDVARAYTASVALRICLDLNLANLFPIDGTSVLVSSLAERTSADQTVLVVVLNLLSRKGIFHQEDQWNWVHTTMSRTLLQPSFNDLLSSLLDESFKSCFNLPELLQKLNYKTPKPGHTAFNECYHSDLDFYRYCATIDHPKGLRFSRAMTHVAEASLRFFEAAYPLQQLETSDLIIDIAGGVGQASTFMAERLPNSMFLVCDYPSVISQGRVQCPAHLRHRIRYEAHDMFQPYDGIDVGAKGARTFFLKQVLHDWSDEECIRILSNILSTLGRSEKLLIIDSVKPKVGSTTLSTAMSDLMVMSTFGGHHRTYGEFETLVHAACKGATLDSRFANAGQHDDFLVLEVTNDSRTQ